MGGLLMLGEELKVMFSHKSAMVLYNLIDAGKIATVRCSDAHYLVLYDLSRCLAGLAFAPFEKLSKHTIDIRRSWIISEDIGVKGAHVYTPGKGHVAVLLSNAAACQDIEKAIGDI